MLTFDLDSGTIAAQLQSRSVSIILFRLNNTTSEFVIRRLARVLDSTASALQAGAPIVVEDGRHRVRRLPIGS